jgi:shikimate kinase
MIIFLLGMPASGKSTLAKKIAEKCPYKVIDLDSYIEERYQKKIPEIFNEGGESLFRKLESESLKELNFDEKTIVSTGGGTPCFYDNMEFILKRGVAVFLDTPLAIILERITENISQRPMFYGKTPEAIRKQLEELYHQRKPFYQKAHYQINNESDFFELKLIKDI